MIYIFDDRAQRREENKEKLRKFSDRVSFAAASLISDQSIEGCIAGSMKEKPKCIIFHKSYVFGDKTVPFGKIREIFMEYKVPIVIFSGGLEGSNKGEQESNMNADLMYENLPYFIESFKEEDEINIDTLLWGKKYKLNTALQFQNKIAEKYFINNNLDDAVDNIDKVKRDILQSSRGLNKDLGEEILAKIDSREHLTWLELAEEIDHTVQKFK